MYTLDIWNIDPKNDGFEKVVPFKIWHHVEYNYVKVYPGQPVCR